MANDALKLAEVSSWSVERERERQRNGSTKCALPVSTPLQRSLYCVDREVVVGVSMGGADVHHQLVDALPL